MEKEICGSEADYLVLRSRRVPRYLPKAAAEGRGVTAHGESGTEPEPQGGFQEQAAVKGEGQELLPDLHHVSYASAECRGTVSASGDSGQGGAGTEDHKGWQETMDQEQEENQMENGEEEASRLNSEEGMTYQEFMRDLHCRTQRMLAHSVKDMCQQMGKVFNKQSEEKDELLKTFMKEASRREELMLRLMSQTAGSTPKQERHYKEPMPFSGTNPREWLLLMKQYYDARGFQESVRLKDAPFHLRGDAHMFYYTLAQHDPERLPTTWEEFEQLILQRFSSRSPVETLQRLMQVKYRDSVSDVSTQFARICAEGDPLPQDKLINVYLSRFPKAMVVEALKEDFKTWVEASQYLERRNRQLSLKLAEWYQLAPPEFKREVEMDRQCQREGWMLRNLISSTTKPFPSRRLGQAGKGAEANKGTQAATRNSAEVENTNFYKLREALVCHQCQGKGHRAKECPSRDLATRRDGSRCRRCGGVGHWARSCPSQGQQWTQQGVSQQLRKAALETVAGQQGNGQA